ncbi:LysR substrate-binding domain-containing protein [Streptomyces tendae]|uniref:LysR substrate-binding domain-containing protein n=1 Tax=Streptomyces tendae TaxID=1932 RepID=UPI0037BE071C
MAEAELELAGLRDRLAGRLATGAYATALLALVPRAMAQLTSDHPGLAVVLEESSTPALLRRLRAGRLDVARSWSTCLGLVAAGLGVTTPGASRQQGALTGFNCVAEGGYVVMYPW